MSAERKSPTVGVLGDVVRHTLAATETAPDGAREFLIDLTRAHLETRAFLELESEIRALPYARVRLARVLEQLERARDLSQLDVIEAAEALVRQARGVKPS